MIYFRLFLYYTFICSSVLFFGIGINRTIQISSKPLTINMKIVLKSFISIFTSTTLSYLLTQYLLVPIGMEELFPLIALFIFLSINTFVESIVRITAKISTAEFSISWLVCILTINESSSLVEALIISTSCMLSFQILLPLVSCFQNFLYLKTYENKERKQILIFLSIVVVMMAMSVCDIVWFNVSGR